MTYAELKNDIISKSTNKVNVSTLINTSDISNNVYTAMLWVARKTIVFELVDSSYQKKLRTVNDMKMAYPIKPSDDSDIIVFDDDIIDAVEYHVLAGIELTRSNIYMAMARSIIEERETGIINELIDKAADSLVEEDY